MADNIDNLQAHEIELLKKEIYLELRTLTDSSLNDFIFDLNQILSTNHLDKSYRINNNWLGAIIFRVQFCLIREHQFIHIKWQFWKITCYILKKKIWPAYLLKI